MIVAAPAAATIDPACLNPIITGICVSKEVGGAVIGGAVNSAGKQGLKDIANDAMAGAGSLIKNIVTFWLQKPSPTAEFEGADSTAVWLQHQLVYFTAAALLAGLFIAAIKMALFSGPQAAKEIAKGLTSLALVSAIALPVVVALMQAGDAFSEAMLKGVKPEDIGAAYVQMADQDLQFGFIVTIVTGIGGIVAGIVQALLLLTRDAMCVLLAGMLPLFAAASMTETGAAAWRKATSWLGAFLLYKPVAALIYATAFKMMAIGPLPKDPSAGVLLQRQLIGIFMLGVALVALPALMRVLAPVMAQVAGGGSGAGAVSTAGTAVATGSRMFGRSGGGGGSAPVPVKSASVSGGSPGGEGRAGKSGGSTPPSGSSGGKGSSPDSGSSGSGPSSSSGSGASGASKPSGGSSDKSDSSAGKQPVSSGSAASSAGGGVGTKSSGMPSPSRYGGSGSDPGRMARQGAGRSEQRPEATPPQPPTHIRHGKNSRPSGSSEGTR